MERAVSERRGPETEKAAVQLESAINVPTDHLDALLGALRRAGLDVWDTGDRVTTEEGIGSLAELRVRFAPP